MTRERYQRLEALFDRAITIDKADARERFLADVSAEDAPLAAELRSLLDSYQAWSQPVALPPPVLLRVGPYECLEQIGAGGMGQVYRARRVDGQFEQQVAVKLMRASLSGEVYRARFLAERQILAQLNHPHIARLLDGGMRPDGEPYLVMELVEGTPLDVYARDRNLDVAGRLELFDQVLDAVDAAHRNLVVHRDLKPSNILVDREGQVKLLDFGTSKLLADDATRTQTPALTPAYASPEQVRGEPVATTSDVYSLGVVLFELLTQQTPFPHPSSYAAAIERAFRPLPVPPAPVPRDLDWILRKALDPAPSARYASVAALSEDLRRYRQGRPILARPPRWTYVAAKFISRNRLRLALAAMAVAALAVTARYAWRQQTQANQRFEESRQIAKYLLFDLFDEVSRLPGSTVLRARMAEKAQAQLDQLAAIQNRPEVQRETAAGYNRLGEIYGVPGRPNLGDTHRALESLRRAAALLDQLPEARVERARNAVLRAKLALWSQQDAKSAQQFVQAAERELEAAPPAEARPVRAQWRIAAGDVADFASQWREEERNARAGLPELEAWPLADREGEDYRVTKAQLYHQLGNASFYAGRRQEALAHFRASRDILVEADRRLPNRTRILYALMQSWYDLGTMPSPPVTPAEQLTALEQAQAVGERLIATEDLDQQVQRSYWVLHQAIAESLAERGKYAEAVQEQQRVVAARRARVEAEPGVTGHVRDLAFSLFVLGEIHRRPRPGLACDAWRESLRRFTELDRQGRLLTWDRDNVFRNLQARVAHCPAR